MCKECGLQSLVQAGSQRHSIGAGERFAAVLGVEQSPLEAILLKRRVMGPSWISIKKPLRLESSAQVSRSS